MQLTYDLSIIGTQNVSWALRSMEKEFTAHNARVRRQIGGGRRRGGPRAPSAAGAVARDKAIADKAASDRIRAEQKVTAAHEREVRRRERAEMAAIKRTLAANQRAQRQAHTRARRAVGFVGRSVRSTVSRGATVVGGMLGIGAGFLASDALAGERRAQAQAAALANQAYGTEGGQGMSRRRLKARALETARSVGIESGLGRDAVIGSMREVQAVSGRFDLAQQLAPFMAELANATDSDLGDVGGATGQVLQSVLQQLKHIEDPAQRAAMAIGQTKEIMNAMAGQAKVGSIEMKDMSVQMAKLMSVSGRYKGETADLVNTLGALTQTAVAGGATNAGEAAIALSRFTDDITQKGSASRGIFKKLKIDPFERKMIRGKMTRVALRDPAELLQEVIAKSRGDVALMSKMFGVRGQKTAEGFRNLYVKAGGGAAGEAAIRKQIAGFKEQRLTDKERRESAEFRKQQGDRQFAIAMEGLKDAMGQELLPVITKAIPKIAEMTPAIVRMTEAAMKLADFLLENPYKGVGAIIGAAVAKDIALAGIGSVISKALGTIMAASVAPTVAGGGGAAAGAGGGVVGKLAASGGGAGGAGIFGISAALAGASGLAGFLQGREAGATLGLGGTGQNVLGGVQGYLGALNPVGAVGLAARAAMGQSLDPTEPLNFQPSGEVTAGGEERLRKMLETGDASVGPRPDDANARAAEINQSAADQMAKSAEQISQAAQQMLQAGDKMQQGAAGADPTAPR